MTLNLIRLKTEGKAVYGRITVQFLNGQTQTYPTLENKDYLIPEGTYPLKMTWSPKFKRNMPEICDVPEREGIRIHRGTRPEHSEGCVLTTELGVEGIRVFIDSFNKWYDEQLYINIKSEQT